MNMRRAFLGQVPLVLGPSSWGAPMAAAAAAPSPDCSPGYWRDQNGACRPKVTMGQGVLEYFDVPLGAFPVPWGMGCPTGQVRDSHGNCVPDTYHMGQSQQMTREGSVLQHFEVPLGAMPVPWNLPCMPGEVRNQDGVCGPDTGAMMGQALPPQCEKTPEGGTRCADGTYTPPQGGTIKAEAPSGGFPWVPVAVGAGAIAAGAALLAGSRRRLGQDFSSLAPNVATAFPTQFGQLADYAAKIDSERAADAFNFQQYVNASKKRYDLLFKQKDAQAALDAANAQWERAHNNADQLQAAQAAVDSISSDLASAAQDVQTYRDAEKVNQDNIASYRGSAEAVIGDLPGDVQAEARKIIDSYPSSSMQGGLRAAPLMRGRF